MSTTFYDPGVGEHVVIDGNIVERKSLYLVEKIQDEFPEVIVLCVDPDLADSPWEEPFQICEKNEAGRVLRIFGCWELNDYILERLRFADMQKHDIQGYIDAHNNKVVEEAKKAREEKIEARKKLVASVAANPTSSYSYKNDKGEVVTFHEDKPATRKEIKVL